MKYRWLALVILATLFVVFAGCSKPDTPQQVATEFWQAMVKGDAGNIADFSTLADTSAAEDINPNWLTTLPEFGRVVIEGDQATIQTILATPDPSGDAKADVRREITTYLVQVDDQWLVDYQRTGQAITSRSPFSGLKNEFDRLRDQFDDAVGRSSEKISEQMDRLIKDFGAYSEETGKKAEEALENFGNSLENLRQQLKESMEEAEKNRQKSEEPSDGSLEQAAI